MKIAIVDDHGVLLDGISEIIKEVPNVTEVDTYLSANEFLDKYRQKEYDLLISDVQMPEKNGVELLSEFRINYSKTPVLIMSMFDDQNIINTLKGLKIQGYLQKKCGAEELKTAISQILAGRTYFDKEIIKKYNREFEDDERVYFSARELQVIQHLAMEKSIKQVADDLCISHNTVDTHKKNIMKKLGTNKTVGIIKYAVENKLL